ncbi:thiamine pyrophosphokinase [Xylariaceae sp. FL0594]|nr:thiamine pyrophosphokinase [Xylariaceae sp. FL0594]
MSSSASPTTGTTTTTDWHPVKRLLGTSASEFTLITLNQPIRDLYLYHDLWSLANTKIAADGGANEIYNLSKQQNAPHEADTNSPGPYTDLDTIIGDLDSLTDEARAYFRHSEIVHVSEQESTDFAKAVHHARRAAPGREIVCVGGLGGRVDQGLSQVHHLCLFQTCPEYSEGRMYLVSEASLSFLLKGGGRTHRIWVRERDAEAKAGLMKVTAEPFSKYVGIIPICGPAVISTRGLEWDVKDWPTSFAGRMSTSNHVLPETEVVEIQTDVDVLFTIGLK